MSFQGKPGFYFSDEHDKYLYYDGYYFYNRHDERVLVMHESQLDYRPDLKHFPEFSGAYDEYDEEYYEEDDRNPEDDFYDLMDTVNNAIDAIEYEDRIYDDPWD